MWAPILFAFYQAQMALLVAWNSALRWNFEGSVFAAVTFNFGPRAICASHLDFAKPRLGLDLRLVIRFPPGSTILIPSAIVRQLQRPHPGPRAPIVVLPNTPQPAFSDGFETVSRTDEDFETSASQEEQAKREAEHGRRWGGRDEKCFP
ncbi:hypothetical protein B0H14DRAFT_3431467 [Mycena olivaceomarginata]|nr:hypothetical protein B0H14DRAFT_3431467 [Mycena olivaceomarginata]